MYGRQDPLSPIKFACTTKTAETWFLASSLSRGFSIPSRSQEDQRKEEEEAYIRLTTRTPMPSATMLDRLGKFIDDQFVNKQPITHIGNLPVPGTKACVEQSAAKGGALIALKLYGDEARINDIVTRIEANNDRLRQLRNAKYFSEDSDGDDIDDDGMTAIYNENSLLRGEAWELTNNLTNPDYPLVESKLSDTFLRAVADKTKRHCKLLPIVGSDGKIRIATIHTASVVWQARAMVSWLMPWLKKLTQTKVALRNKELHLVNNHDQPDDLRLFSADLAKSTDPISIDLSLFVLNRITKHTGTPDWWQDALENVITDHTIAGRPGKIQCGALMGLGPSWIVLCLLNAFAAADAGARAKDHAICGDDLIGLWTEGTIRQYQANIVSLGLANNYKKSYISRKYGVFCERFVYRKSKLANSAVGPQIVRIGESAALKTIQQEKGRLVVDSLVKITKDSSTHKIIKSLAKRTALALSPASNIPGLLTEGGGGSTMPIDAINVLVYAKFGPIGQFKVDAAPELRDFRDALRTMPNCTGGVEAESVITAAKAHLELLRREQYRTPASARKLKSFKEIRDEIFQKRRFIFKTLQRMSATQFLVSLLRPDGNSYVRSSEKLRKNSLREFRLHHFGAALRELSASWRQEVSPLFVAGLFNRTFPSYKPQSNLRLQPALSVWDSKTSA